MTTNDAEATEAQWRDLGREIEQARRAKGLRKSEAARKADISVSTWSTLEAGGRNYKGRWMTPSPSNETLVRIGGALGYPYRKLFRTIGREAPVAFTQEGELRLVDATVDFNSRIARLSPGDQRYVDELVERLLRERDDP